MTLITPHGYKPLCMREQGAIREKVQPKFMIPANEKRSLGLDQVAHCVLLKFMPTWWTDLPGDA